MERPNFDDDEFEVRDVILTPDNACVHIYQNPKANHVAIDIGDGGDPIGELVSLEQVELYREFHIPIVFHQEQPSPGLLAWADMEIDKIVNDFSAEL